MGGLRAVHELPERSFGQMTHIDPQTEPLRLPDKVAPTRRQAKRGAVPARKRVVGIPRQREHAEALFPQPFESARSQPMTSQPSTDSSAAILPCSVRRRASAPFAAKPMRLRFFSTSRHRSTSGSVSRRSVPPPGHFIGVAAERKDLGIGLQSGRLLQVDVAGIPFQPLPARPELIGGVAVSVKQLHENASSRCRISGRFVCVPFGA